MVSIRRLLANNQKILIPNIAESRLRILLCPDPALEERRLQLEKELSALEQALIQLNNVE